MTLDDLEGRLEGGKAMFLEPREVFDAAIIGLARRIDGLHVVAYDSDRVVRALMDAHGLDETDAQEWYAFSTTGADVGTGTPVFVQLCEQAIPKEQPRPALSPHDIAFAANNGLI